MAHFAKIEDGIVREVIVVNNEVLLDDKGVEQEELGAKFCVELFGGTWVQTSYNANFRGKYAGIGDYYDSVNDIFVAPQPFPSWTLDKETYLWTAPVAMPTDGKPYTWNEDSKSWDKVGLLA